MPNQKKEQDLRIHTCHYISLLHGIRVIQRVQNSNRKRFFI